MGWNYLLILLIVSLVLSAVGFKKYVYFMSLGYGFSVAGIGIALIVFSLTGFLKADITLFVYYILFIIYGFRLSGFLAIRELKNLAYRKTLAEAAGDSSKMPFFVKAVMWIACAALYVMQTSPVFFRALNGKAATLCFLIGAGISVCGIVLESVADRQKSIQKKARPDMVAMKGLYRFVRCPNYFGEILFWTGVFVSGFDIYAGAGQWIMAVIAYICIIIVMFNGAQRLEKRQVKRYGSNREYTEYTDHTPIIIPLLPLYHLYKEK